MLGERNHSHCLVTRDRRHLEEAHAGILLTATIFFLYSSLFAVSALYLKYDDFQPILLSILFIFSFHYMNMYMPCRA